MAGAVEGEHVALGMPSMLTVSRRLKPPFDHRPAMRMASGRHGEAGEVGPAVQAHRVIQAGCPGAGVRGRPTGPRPIRGLRGAAFERVHAHGVAGLDAAHLHRAAGGQRWARARRALVLRPAPCRSAGRGRGRRRWRRRCAPGGGFPGVGDGAGDLALQELVRGVVDGVAGDQVVEIHIGHRAHIEGDRRSSVWRSRATGSALARRGSVRLNSISTGISSGMLSASSRVPVSMAATGRRPGAAAGGGPVRGRPRRRRRPTGLVTGMVSGSLSSGGLLGADDQRRPG